MASGEPLSSDGLTLSHLTCLYQTESRCIYPDLIIKIQKNEIIGLIINNLICSISDHADLLKRISIGLIAGGLIFKDLNSYLPITKGYSTFTSGRKPLKIRPLPTLGGISFEISSFEDRHNLQQLLYIYIHFLKITIY